MRDRRRATRILWRIAPLLVLVHAGPLAAQTLCPDGSYVSGESCQLCPDGSYVGGDAGCSITPSGSFVPSTSDGPQLAPDGSYVPGGAPTILCPDGSWVSGSTCVLAPDGSYVGE